MAQIEFSVEISIKTDIPLFSDTESSSLIETCYDGEIIGTHYDEESNKLDSFPIGSLRFKHINLNRRYEFGISIYDAIDVTQDIHDNCMPLIDDEEDSLSEDLFGMSTPPFSSNVLIISEIALLEEYRGQNIALGVMREIIERFHHDCGVVVLKPFPLQFGVAEKKRKKLEIFKLSELSKDQSRSTRKLSSHYSKLGFKRYKRSKLMILDPRNSLPSLNDLGFSEYGEFVKKI